MATKRDNQIRTSVPAALFSRFAPRVKKDAGADQELLPSKLLDVLLRQERARADRSGTTFVVISFDVEIKSRHQDLRPKTMQVLADCVSSCLRLSDVKGWLHDDGEVVAAILPGTTKEKSYIPVRRMEHLFFQKLDMKPFGRDDLPKLQCRVYTYPGEGGWGRTAAGNGNGFSKAPFELKPLEETLVASAPVAGANGNGQNE